MRSAIACRLFGVRHRLAVAHETDTAWVGGLARIPLAYAALARGELERARLLIDEAVAIFRSSGDKWALTILLVNLCHVLTCCGELDEAGVAAREGMWLCEETADRRSLSWCLCFLAAAMVGRKQATRAVRLWGAAERISQSIGSPLAGFLIANPDLHLTAVREALGDEAFNAAWGDGLAMTPDAAIAYALRDDESE
jgi:hypothetical protein